jgi:hypothetical protein
MEERLSRLELPEDPGGAEQQLVSVGFKRTEVGVGFTLCSLEGLTVLHLE